MFKRVISNILANALNYSFNNKKIYIKIKSFVNEISITFNDQGQGIEEKHLATIFDRFYRADVSRSNKTGGLGLGLAIVKSIMDLHHGRIEISSKINVGTSVSLFFPL